MIGQTKLGSLTEAVLNVGGGYLLALLTQLVVFPLFDIRVDFGEQLGIAGIFTVISIARTYLWRRIFEWHQRNHERPG